MTFAQRQNRLTTHFSERIPIVKRRISVHTRSFYLPKHRISSTRANWLGCLEWRLLYSGMWCLGVWQLLMNVFGRPIPGAVILKITATGTPNTPK